MDKSINAHAAIALLAAATFLVSACDDGVSLAPGVGAPTPARDAGEGEFRLISSEPVVFEGKGNPRLFDLLADSRFAAFGGGGAAEWDESGARWQQMTGAPNAAELVEDAERTVLSIQPDPKGVELRQQTADLGPVDSADWLVATMRAKANKRYTLGLVVSFAKDGNRVEAAEGHPGDGQWHNIELALPVPQGLTQNVFDCSLVYVGNPDSPALIESARLRLERREEAAGGNLVVNGGFERYRFTKLPYPWSMDAWNSNRQPPKGGDVSVVQASGKAEGAAALSFTRPDPSTNIRVSQPVLRVAPDNAGAKLVASAIGLASHKQELWLQLRCQKDGRDVAQQKKFAIHPGDGAWHEMRVELTVPPANVADTVYIDAFRRSFTDERAEIDNIRVERR